MRKPNLNRWILRSSRSSTPWLAAWPGKIMQKQQAAQGAQIRAGSTGPDQRP
jgi:hypothetical protein